MKPKLIVVAFHMGRVGSSAVMGLLVKLGAYTGDKNKLSPSAAMNPKGFFELKSQSVFMRQVFNGVYPDVASPPSISFVENIANKNYLEYGDLLKRELGCNNVLAVKSQRMLTLPMLIRLKDMYDIKVIVLHREINMQARSTRRVWDKSNKFPEFDESFISNWLNDWKKFSNEILNNYKFDVMDLSFEELIDDPYNQMKNMAQFIGVDEIPKSEVLQWIDKKLVNRKMF